jgi:hypothetical protein
MLLKLGTPFIALVNKVLDKLHDFFVVLLCITFKQQFGAFRGLIGKLPPSLSTCPAFLFPWGYQGVLLNPNLSSWQWKVELQCCRLLKGVGVKFHPFVWVERI